MKRTVLTIELSQGWRSKTKRNLIKQTGKSRCFNKRTSITSELIASIPPTTAHTHPISFGVPPDGSCGGHQKNSYLLLDLSRVKASSLWSTAEIRIKH